ncbi:hypothetical protein BUALT_Bualt16G0079000 [Buddleja alternifolia]|uniref:Uncharacterized protein n=1 Tax=Buddleja alternifolia TaxID=168488 RepID=A0AAV6WAM4_9LAMI|nr:hypothetical protein BUALT_Bualt16G0079000 [Buddleja alternifolia]
MQGTQILTKMLCRQHGGAAVALNHQRRWMVGKAGNRAAVHGSKLLVPHTIPNVQNCGFSHQGTAEDPWAIEQQLENVNVYGGVEQTIPSE